MTTSRIDQEARRNVAVFGQNSSAGKWVALHLGLVDRITLGQIWRCWVMTSRLARSRGLVDTNVLKVHIWTSECHSLYTKR